LYVIPAKAGIRFPFCNQGGGTSFFAEFRIEHIDL